MNQHTYFGCKVAQRGEGNAVDFFIFVVSAKDLAQWAGVRRVGRDDRGTQRLVKQSRLNAIRRFFTVNLKNTIPTGIVVAFDPSTARFDSFQQAISTCLPNINILNDIQTKIDWGTLSFKYDGTAEEHLRPAFVVDGQHRLKAISELEEDVPVLVIALVNASTEEQAFQFVVINNKAAKVPTDNVKAILASINEEALQSRLLQAGVSYGGISAILKEINDDPSSPFYKLLDWPLTPSEQGIIQLTSIEACLRYIRNQFPALEGDEDTQKEIFMSIWSAVKSCYGDLWIENEKFMSKVNIVALNEFIADRLAYAYEGNLLDIYQTDLVQSQTKTILNLIPSDFWLVDWKIRLQDSSAMRIAIKDDLKVISQNTRAGNPTYENTRLIGETVG